MRSKLTGLALIIMSSFMLSGCFLVGRLHKTDPSARRNWERMTQDEIRAVPLQELVDHLRYEYDKYECPLKSDRVHIPEDVWQKIDWTDEEKYRNAALPHKLWNMRHDDHEWPSCQNWRGDDAYGYRAGEGHDKYFPRLPQLIKGRGVARWMTPGDTSIIEIPLFKDYSVIWTTSTIPDTVEVTERRCGKSNYGQTFTLTKEELLSQYAPSPIQQFSDKSYVMTYPLHTSYHVMIKRKEEYCDPRDVADDVYFWRYGWRWDSYDEYYIKGGFFLGGHWN